MDKIAEIEQKLEKCKTIAINLKVDNNILEAKVTRLKKELAAARAEIAERNRGEQTIRNLRVLDDKSDDDTGISPYDTGVHKNPWEKVR